MTKSSRVPASALASARNRRERRRLSKTLKKERHMAYCKRKMPPQNSDTPSSESQNPIAERSTSDRIGRTGKKDEQKQKKKNAKKRERAKKQRHEQQREMIEMEDREIRSYAKKLGLNKRRKTQTLPKAFSEMGLDYLLNFCREPKTAEDDNDPMDLGDSDGEEEEGDDFVRSEDLSDNEDDGASVSSAPSVESVSKRGIHSRKRPKKASDDKETKRVRFSGLDNDDEEDESENDADGTDGDLERSDDENDQNQSDNDEEDRNLPLDEDEETSNSDGGELREDIYGRLRDKKGNIVQLTAGSSSTRPKLLSTNQSGDMGDIDPKLVRSLKGNLNRLSESNARQIANQIAQLLITYSKNDVKTVMTRSIFGVCLAPEIVPHRLIMEYCYLLAIIHSSIGVELSSYFIERLATEFRDLHEASKAETDQRIVDKRINNACQMLTFCYHLKIVSSALIVQLISDIVASFTERDVELMLLLLQSVGFMLRKDNPVELKSLVGEIHRKINAPENVQLKESARTKFMLDTLLAIKNNNDTKMTSYDPSLSEHFRKILRAAVKTIEPPLPMTLHDVYAAEEKGRWWIVGSAVSSALIDSKRSENNPSSVTARSIGRSRMEFDDGLLELAKKHRMNTDLRRTIFCILMSAEDYLDAFEKLIKLDLRGQQEREIIHVCLTCCLNERRFNPYYGWLVRHLCQYHKRFQLTTQFAVWDKFKLLKELESWQRANLARLLSQLIASKAVSISVLKVFEFGELETISIKLLKAFFEDLLLTNLTTKDEVEEIFKRAATKDELKVFFNGLLVFLQHFFSDERSKLTEEKRDLLNDRIAIIERLQFR